MVRGEWQQGEMACPLDGRCQVSLTLGTVSRFLAGFDSTTIGDKTPDARNVLVIDRVFFAVALASASAAASERRA
jgi:hypothetical protein